MKQFLPLIHSRIHVKLLNVSFIYFFQEKIPVPPDDEKIKKLGRNAAIGFVASVVSDTTSNSLREGRSPGGLKSSLYLFNIHPSRNVALAAGRGRGITQPFHSDIRAMALGHT